MQGFIALHRELLDKPIWKKSTPEQKSILITLLLLANHEETEWEWMGRRFKISPGQFVTSLESLAEKSGVSIQNIRTALLKFSKYDFLTNESTKTGRIITITNWGVYQDAKQKPNKPPNKDLTKTQQRPNKDLTTNNNDNNDNNEIKKEDIVPYKEIVFHLNQVCNKNYKHTTETTKKHIHARWVEGHRLEQFKTVIDNKATSWLGTDMEKFLRPETLFGTKFEGYLNEKPKPPPIPPPHQLTDNQIFMDKLMAEMEGG